MNLADLVDLKQEALRGSPGMNDPFLQARDESWAPYLRFLYLCTYVFEPTVAVELGTFMGTAAAHMASGNPRTQVIAIDIDPQPEAYEAEEQYPNLEVWQGDSCAFHLELTTCPYEEIGLIFLDSLHDGERPRIELGTYKDLLTSPALVIVDDLLGPEHLRIPMQEFWEELPEPKIALHELHPQRIAPGIAYHDAPGFGVCIWT